MFRTEQRQKLQRIVNRILRKHPDLHYIQGIAMGLLADICRLLTCV